LRQTEKNATAENRQKTDPTRPDPTRLFPTPSQDYGNLSETEAKRLVMATQVNVLKMESQLERYVPSGGLSRSIPIVGRDKTVSTPQS
jgi:hypothetical protein